MIPGGKREEIMFCVKCGKELKEGAGFCKYCGTQVRMAETSREVSRDVPPAISPEASRKVSPGGNDGEEKEEQSSLYRSASPERRKAQQTTGSLLIGRSIQDLLMR